MCAFVAAIRRVPGAGFVKGPRSPNFTAIPVQTTINNLQTYFNVWPKCASTFLLYGPKRPLTTLSASEKPVGDPLQQKTAANPSGAGISDGGEHLYGPNMTPPLPTTGGGGSDAAQAAAAQAAAAAAAKPLGLAGLLRRFRRGEKLAMVTAYDFPSARLARGAGVDIILVGDSLGNCRLGLPDTVGVTMDDMLRATRAARRGVDAAPGVDHVAGAPKPVLVGDMPFGSYLFEAEALRNAAEFRMAGAELVKMEGGRSVAPLVEALTRAGIPIMGHIGLLPQSATLQGGLRMQGTTAESAAELVKDARALADAGAVCIVIECVPLEVGAAVQAAVPNVPVIGIGAGGGVAGQVLVCDDLLGLHGSPPSFVKLYADIARTSAKAYAEYATEVRSGAFPAKAHFRKMKAEEWDKLHAIMPDVCECAEGALPKEAPAPPARELAAQTWSTSTTGTVWPPLTQRSNGGVPKQAWLELVAGRFVPSTKAGLVQARAMSNSAAEAAPVQMLRTLGDVRAWRKALRQEGRKVAFVPTMGNLHEGHLELVDAARERADDVIVSIFVNPAQFAAHEDLDKYPRTLERDVQLLQERGVRAVFAPGPDEIYPSGSPGGTVVVPRFVQGKSEDACRPHFFTGVATVCLKLFNLTQPDVAIFGQKDAMQCVVIAHMLKDLLLDDQVHLVVAPTSREADGLARSSRNSYLTPGMRARAPAIYKALSSTTADVSTLSGDVRRLAKEQLEAVGFEVSYISVADLDQMDERADDEPVANSVVSVAALIREGDVQCRLIDNVVVPAGP